MPFYYRKYLRYLEIAFYFLLLFFFVPLRVDESNNNYDTNTTYQFKQYLIKYNKSYPNKTVFNLRLEAFEKSLKTIELLNKNKTSTSAIYGLTKFADLLPYEFFDEHLQKYPIVPTNKSTVSNDAFKFIKKRSTYTVFPQQLDWRERNVITKVRSQHNCGACWAFAAIETVESMYAIKTGRLEEFSIQQMIDCAKNNYGCDGGDTCTLLQWMQMEKVKVVGEIEYPLLLKQNECKNVTISKSEVFLSNYTCQNLVHSEDIILALLAKHGPVSVAINAKTWQHYIGGIIQFHCDSDSLNLNHAVQIVGYDLTAEVPYYIVRNSWGSDFGDNGYLYIAVGGNLCGLAYEVSAVNIL